MATLAGSTIASTYDSLLHVEDNTAGLVATSTDSRVIQDGVGANSALALATDSVRITSTNKLYFNDVGGEYISGDGTNLTITSGADIIFATAAGGSVYYGGAAGTYNTVYGNNAGDALLAGGSSNTLIGFDAGGSITGGDANVMVGRATGGAITTGVNNCAIGNDALTTETIGNNSTALGNAALAMQLSDSPNEITENTGVGYAAGYYNEIGTGNTSVGYYSMAGADGESNSDNTALGAHSGAAITDGIDNVIIGYRAGDALTEGDSNILIGKHAAGASQLISGVIAIGHGASSQANMTTAADGTIAIGHQAGFNISSGIKNISIGYQALYTEDTGDYNIAIGYRALEDQNVDGTVGNVAVGYQCGKEISTGVGNVGMGYNAMGAASASAMTGTGNVCIGQGAGYVLTSADKNVIIGYESGIGQTTADSNVLIGYLAGRNITTGSSNVFIGESSGGESASNSLAGGGNVGVGRNSLRQADGDMEKNTAIGFAVLEDGNNNSVLRNTGVGYAALNVAGTGGAVCDNNVALGTNAGVAVTSGDANAFIGTYCGDNITSGNYNTYLGYNCEASAYSVDTEIAIGNGLTGGGTETVRIGVSTDYITCDFGENATWGHSSDKRIKKDIEDNSLGLEFVKKLRTVTFTKKAPSEYPKEFEQYDENVTERKYPNRKNYGFIAQEVKKAMDEVGHSEFPVWKENRDGMQELGEAELITPLVKAVQELSAKVEELESKLNN